MKYMLMFANHEDEIPGLSAAERGAMFQEIGAWWEEHSKAGRITSGAQLQPSHTATSVRFGEGEPLVTDGPFIESKETVGGYAIVDVPDLDAALALARTWPARGIVEVRPLVPDDEMGRM